METRSATRRAAADAFSSRFPTELWVEICSYLSYGELVATVGRLSRYHRELLDHSPLDALLFRKELAEDDAVATPSPLASFKVHPLLQGLACWQTGQDVFRLASDLRSAGVPVLDLPARLEMATSPPVNTLFINVFPDADDFLWAPGSRLVSRSGGVTVEDALQAFSALLSTIVQVGWCEECEDYHEGPGPRQRYDFFCFGRSRTVTLWPEAGISSAGLAYLILES
jgi:hypothetical protein